MVPAILNMKTKRETEKPTSTAVPLRALECKFARTAHFWAVIRAEGRPNFAQARVARRRLISLHD